MNRPNQTSYKVSSELYNEYLHLIDKLNMINYDKPSDENIETVVRIASILISSMNDEHNINEKCQIITDVFYILSVILDNSSQELKDMAKDRYYHFLDELATYAVPECQYLYYYLTNVFAKKHPYMSTPLA